MSRARIVILIVLVAALLLTAELTGLRARLTLDGIRTMTASCGAWAVLAFIAVFVVAHAAHLPGMVFVAAAALTWGRLAGFAIGWLGAVLAVSASFLLVRSIGGKVQTQRPSLKKIFATLEKRPIRAVIALRVVFWTAPTVNIGLALSPIRFRDFVIGSMIGLLPPVLVTALFVDRLVAWIWH